MSVEILGIIRTPTTHKLITGLGSAKISVQIFSDFQGQLKTFATAEVSLEWSLLGGNYLQ